MRLFEDLLDDIDARTIDTAAAVADEVFNDPDDPTMYDHQFRIEWFCEDAVSQHDIDWQIEKIIHILDACSGVNDYSSVLYLTRDDRLTALNVPYIQEAPTKHYDMFFVFSVQSQFRTVKQLFGFIMKLRSCFDFQEKHKNDMGMEYSYMEIISAREGQWGFPTDDYDTPDTYEALTTTELSKFINNTTKGHPQEDRGDLNEAYKVATMFFDDRLKVIGDFQRYYKESFDKTIQQWTFRYLEDGETIELHMRDFDNKVGSTTINLESFADYVQGPAMLVDEAKLFIQRFPIGRTRTSIPVNPITARQLSDANDMSQRPYKFVYDTHNHTLFFIVYLGILPDENPKVTYLTLKTTFDREFYLHRDNNSKAFTMARRINILYDDFLDRTALNDFANEIISVVRQKDKAVS